MSVFCINMKHPRFQALVKQTDLPAHYLRMEVSVWMEENNMEEIPTAEQLGLEIVNPDVVIEPVPGEESMVVIESKLELPTSDETMEIINSDEVTDKEAKEMLAYEENKRYILEDHDFDSDVYDKRREQFDNYLAPNGEKSKLFEQLMEMSGNEALAKKRWMQFYSPEFRQFFGDWLANTDNDPVDPAIEKLFDENPTLANAVYDELGYGEFENTYVYKTDIVNKFDADVETIINGMRNVSIADDEDYDIDLELQLAKENNIQYLTYQDEKDNTTFYIFYNDRGEAQAREILKLEQSNISRKQYQAQLGYLLQYDIDDVSKFSGVSRDKINRLVSPEEKQKAVRKYSQYLAAGNKNDIKAFRKYVKSNIGFISTSVSKAVDENGEPRLFYDARTNPELDAYSNPYGVYRPARFFTTQMPVDPNKNPPVVLQVKDPLRRKNDFFTGTVASHIEAINNTNKEGVFIENDDNTTTAVVFSDAQIRPAFPLSTQGEQVYFQVSPELQRKNDAELDKKIERFLEKIGVSIHSVNKIRDRNGKVMNATAKADMLGKIIEVVKDRASIDTLPEEAAHFFVEMLGENHPLYKRMYRDITSFEIYRKTLEQYKNVASYRNEDGTINIDKMKKEAMGKAIALHIIEADQNEKQNLLDKIEAWWEDFLEMMRDVFGDITDNPFMDAAQMILNADISALDLETESSEEFFSQRDALSLIREDQTRIQFDDTIDPLTREKRHTYSKDGVVARGSVTSFYVEPWLRKIFRGPDTRDEARKLIDIAKADYGDLIHLQFQEIVRSWTNPDGTKRATQGPVEQILPGGMYKTVNDYVQQIMAQYPEGTVFMPEVKIFDSKKRIGGTIDLLIVEPDGKFSIYDWKSQEIFRGQDDLKPYKEKMYRIQLEEYVKILKKEYGLSEVKTIRAIPIRTQFNYKDNKLYNLRAIEIGDIDPRKIPDDKSYLLPVVLQQEPTGNEQLDGFITQLNAILQKMETQRYSYSKEEVYKKKEEINRLRLAIRDLQLRSRIDKLVVLGMAEYKKYKTRLDKKQLTGKDIRESIRTLEVFSKSSVMLYDMREEQLALLKKDKTKNKEKIKEFNDVNRKFLSMSANIAKLIDNIKKYQLSLVEEKANEFGIKNIMEAEADLGFIPRNFQALSNINRKVYRTFSRVLTMAQGKRDVRVRKTVNELADLKKTFVKWASSKNLSVNKAMEMMLNIDEKGNWNGNFLARYESEYYKKRAEAVKTGDIGWVMNNTKFDKEAYENSLEKMKEVFRAIRYDYDEVKNEQIIKEKLVNWIDNHNIYNDDGSLNNKALMNIENNRFLKPNDKWLTQRWKTLFEQDAQGNYVNKPVVDVYNYFVGLSKYAKNLGMMDEDSPRSFIPNMYATNMENIAFGDISGLLDGNTLAKLEVDSGTQYTPEVDPTNGEVIQRIPVYFTKDVGVKREDGTWDYSKKSRDLFKVFGIWAGHMYNYEAMHDIEDTALMLVEAERNKQSLVTDQVNRVVIENNRVKVKNRNDVNASTLEEFVNYYLYDKQSGNMKDVTFKDRFAQLKNKIQGKNDEEVPELSLTKTVQTGVNYFGIKTLALNFISASAQLVGGGGNMLFQALKGQSFNTKTWGQAIYATMSSKKARAALAFMDITEGSGKEGMFNDLSLVAGDRVINKHNAFFLQRVADKSITQPVVIAMMMEHMLDENNNVVSIADTIKKKYNYDTIYSLPEAEREATRKKIDEEIEELREKKSLLAVGKMNDKGEFTVEGLDQENQSFLMFKQKIIGVIKKAIGNTGRDDINNVRTGMLGSAAMQFRSWIPEMAEDRFDGLKFDDETQTWTYGRYNLFFRQLISKHFPGIVKGIFNGFKGVDIIAAAKEKYLELKADYRLQDKELEMTEAEFIDLYIGTMRSMIAELAVATGVILTLMSLSSGDDGEKKSGVRRLMIRAFKKYQNEFLFYLNPTEFTSVVNNPLPFLGLTQDFSNFLDATKDEIFGQYADDEEAMKKAQPMKYFYKMFPVGKEALLIFAAFDDDFRKEYDIRLDSYFYK